MSWRKHAKTAEQLFAERQYLDAAEHFEMAWRRKTDKLEYLYKSGEIYLIIRDFRKAAEAFRIVRDRTNLYPLANLKYAQCLKQVGKYKEALVEFRKFKGEYGGEDKAEIEVFVNKEIEGCELGQTMEVIAKNSPLKIEHLNANVNTLAAEFAPIPFAEDILYFSSNMAGNAKIYRTQRKNGTWVKASILSGFPEIEGQHFCNGTFAPDGKRFYYTQCEAVQAWGGLSSRCEIYFIKRENDEWTKPQRLLDYVNSKNATTTHPYVIHDEGKEIIYFSSNREGGQGGMDIWYMERDLADDGIDFSFPANAGLDINSSADEITPFYSIEDKALFFSSNGKINIGGYDVFKSIGSKATWSKAEILPAPINSNADDYFYRTKPKSLDGFFVSNRTFGMEKITSTHEDIFAFYQPVAKALVSGTIQDHLSKKPIQDVEVSLYEIVDSEHVRLLEAKTAKDGAYEFNLIPNRQFRVEARKVGYKSNTYEFETDALEEIKKFGQSIYLQKMAPQRRTITTPNNKTTSTKKTAASRLDQPASDASKNIKPTPKRYTSKAKTPGEPDPYTTNAPRHNGIYYKVQIIAVVKYDPNQSRYNPVRNLGRLDTEYIPNTKLTRVLLADYFSLKEAERVLEKVVKHRSLESAYIVRYEDGKRMGRWK